MIKNIYKLNKKVYNKVALAFFLSLFFIVAGVIFAVSPISSAEDTPSQYCLRDDYYVGLADQGNFGNCWAFASVKALEGYLAQTTGEHFEINESHIASTRLVGFDSSGKAQPEGNILGGSGELTDFKASINSNGFTVDDDFGYDGFYYLNADNNKQFIQMLNEKADKSISISSSLQTTKSDVKSCLKNYLNCVVNIENWGVNDKFELVSGRGGAHSVYVMGWDDNYIASDESKGAYIILNSYGIADGNDGVLYLPYNSEIKTSFHCFDFNLPEDYVYLTSSNAHYSVNMKGKYYLDMATQTILKDKNIFEVGGDVKITYSFPQDLANLDYSIDFYLGNENVDDKFYVVKDGDDVHVSNKDELASGSYTVKINYAYDKDGQTQNRSITKQIFMFDGLEVEDFSTRNQAGDTIPASTTQSSNGDIVYIQDYAKSMFGDTIQIDVKFTPYSNWTSYSLKKGQKDITSGSNSSNLKILNLRISASELRDANNEFLLTLGNKTHEKTYKIVINGANYGQDDMIDSLLFADLGGGYVESPLPTRLLFDGQDEFDTISIQSPTKQGYVFTGYKYLSKDNTWKDLNDQNGKYYLLKTNILTSTADNFYTMSHEGLYRNYCFIKAEYEKQDLIQFNDNLSNTLDYSSEITLNLTQNAQNVTWFLDKKALDGNLVKDLKCGSYLVEVTCSIDGQTQKTAQTLYIKKHIYNVNVGQTQFTYNQESQYPAISIDGLESGVDYQIILPNDTTNAQDFKQIKIKLLKGNLFIDKDIITYNISRKNLDLTFEPCAIMQGQNLPTKFDYTCTGYLESEPLNIEFAWDSMKGQYATGEYEIDFVIKNSVDIMRNYDITDIKKPILYIMPLEFDESTLSLATSNMSNQKLSEFFYGQNFVIFFDSPLPWMIQSANYVVKGENFEKTFSSKQQIITEHLPVGKYSITANGELLNGDTIKQRQINIEIKKLDVKIILDDITCNKGEKIEPTYKIESDYLDAVTGLTITPIVENLDVDKAGQYSITAKIDGDTSNYNIQIIAGKYIVKDESALTLTLIIVLVSLIVLAGVALIVRIKIKKKKAN